FTLRTLALFFFIVFTRFCNRLVLESQAQAQPRRADDLAIGELRTESRAFDLPEHGFVQEACGLRLYNRHVARDAVAIEVEADEHVSARRFRVLAQGPHNDRLAQHEDRPGEPFAAKSITVRHFAQQLPGAAILGARIPDSVECYLPIADVAQRGGNRERVLRRLSDEDFD